MQAEVFHSFQKVIMMSYQFLLFAMVGACAILSATCASTLRGIAPERQALFQGTEFTCGDGTRIPIAQVNDNYCDCFTDGSDEPGTAACSLVDQDTKAFHCPNVGHLAHSLFRSQVDDGLCDCCDGSDELEGVCPNDCATAAAKHAEEGAAREVKRQQGLIAKADLLKKAQSIREDKAKQIQDLRAQSASLDDELLRLENVKTAEEATERTEREAVHTASLGKKAEWDLEQLQKAPAEQPAAPEEAPAQDKLPALACVSWRQTKNCDGGGEREDGRDLPCDTSIDMGASGYCECEGVYQYPFDCNHEAFTCQDICANRGVPTPKKDEAASTEPASFKVDDGSSHERQEAKTARDQHSSKHNEKMDAERKIGEFEAELKEEYGPKDGGDPFLAIRDECFKKEAGEYTYELCLFKEVTQKKTSGGYSNSNLGKWKGFQEQTYSSWGGGKDFSKMIFDNGDHCYSGPIRSTTVHVVCGPTNVVLDLNEPSMCTYSMTFQTPAACE